MSFERSNPGFSVIWSIILGRESSNPDTNSALRSGGLGEEMKTILSARRALCNQLTAWKLWTQRANTTHKDTRVLSDGFGSRPSNSRSVIMSDCTPSVNSFSNTIPNRVACSLSTVFTYPRHGGALNPSGFTKRRRSIKRPIRRPTCSFSGARQLPARISFHSIQTLPPW